MKLIANLMSGTTMMGRSGPKISSCMIGAAESAVHRISVGSMYSCASSVLPPQITSWSCARLSTALSSKTRTHTNNRQTIHRHKHRAEILP